MTQAPVTTAELLAAITPWLPAQRWFHEHQNAERLVVVESFELVDPAGKARLLVLLLGEGPQPAPPYVQVPLSLRPAGTLAHGAGRITTLGDDDGASDVYDGPGDPAFVRAWLTAAAAGDEAPPVRAGVARVEDLDPDVARVVSGEQSNTSVIVPARDQGSSGAILKVFRGVWPGRNPDVDVPAALARISFEHVPAPIAWLDHAWGADRALSSRGEDDEPTTPASESFAQLGVLSAFVPGAQDGFELACDMAGRGESFEAAARQLGAVIAELHEALTQALPVGTAPTEAAELMAHLHLRVRWAVAEVPSLDVWQEPVGLLVDRLAGIEDLPRPQRIHGDLHLGQLLHAHDEWFVLDFEGEPLVPLAERAQPDLALRDVAGILRSFDYAAARGGADESWTAAAREAFLDAYRTAAPSAATPSAALALRAFEVDKALYEVVYETQNRPDWAAIPTRALYRLVGSPRDATGDGRVGT